MNQKIIQLKKEEWKFKNQSNAMTYTYKVTGRGITREKLKDYIESLMKTLLKKNPSYKNAKLWVSVLYKDLGEFRSGKSTLIDERPNIWIPQYADQIAKIRDKIKAFMIVLKKDPLNTNMIKNVAKVGKSDHNDCVFDELLMPAVNYDKSLLSPLIRSPAKLKEFCGVERDDMIDIMANISKIEDVQKWRFNISGDVTYVSQKNYPYCVNAEVKNNHIKHKSNKGRYNDICILGKQKKENLLVYKFTKLNTVETYDGKNFKRLTIGDFNDIIKMNSNLLVNAKGKDVKECYDTFVLGADYLLEETKGYVNMYRFASGYNACRYYWTNYTKAIPNPDQIDPLELKEITEAITGALSYAVKGERKNIKELDLNANYADRMSSGYFQFPIKSPTSRIKYTQQEFDNLRYPKFGMYRAIIERSKDEKINALFRFNPRNRYTHIDIKSAQELKLKIKIIEEGDYNFTYYDQSTLINGKQAFGKYMDYFFKLSMVDEDKYSKASNRKKIKDFIKFNFISIMWGSLSKKDTKYMSVDMSQDNGKIDFGEYDILSFTCDKEQNKIVYKLISNDVFVSDWARIAPFILSFVRNQFMKKVLKYKDSIIRIHTDSIWIPNDTETDFEIGTNMGQWKCKKLGDVVINSLNDFTTQYER